MQDLPNEVLEEFFHKVLAVAGRVRENDRHRQLGNLLLTCQTWANVAKSSPRLWSVLPQMLTCDLRGPRVLPVIKRYLQRSAAHPLTFQLQCTHLSNLSRAAQSARDHFARLLLSECRRWAHVQLQVDCGFFMRYRLPESSTIGDFPLLQTLELGIGRGSLSTGVENELINIMDFASCPMLKKAIIQSSGELGETGLPNIHVQLPFAQLRTFEYQYLERTDMRISFHAGHTSHYFCVGDRQGLEGLISRFQTVIPPTELDIYLHSNNNGLVEAANWFKDNLTLPTLVSLYLAGAAIEPLPLVLPFIRRSNCLLRRLSIINQLKESTSTTDGILFEVLSICPSIKVLHCAIPTPSGLYNFVVDPSKTDIVAPSLRQLTMGIETWDDWWLESAARTDVRALKEIDTTRRYISDDFEVNLITRHQRGGRGG